MRNVFEQRHVSVSVTVAGGHSKYVYRAAIVDQRGHHVVVQRTDGAVEGIVLPGQKQRHRVGPGANVVCCTNEVPKEEAPKDPPHGAGMKRYEHCLVNAGASSTCIFKKPRPSSPYTEI